MRLRYFIAMLLCVPFLAYAQNVSDNNGESSFDEVKQRLGFHTNVINWMLTTPNLGVEYDVVNDGYKKISILVSAKYNWETKHTNPFSQAPRYRYNIAGAKLEGRYYFRTRKREAQEEAMLKYFSGLGSYSKSYVRNQLFLAKESPRSYRAYYIAPYITFDNYDIKLADKGYDGNAVGLGVSFGYNTPLYQYNNGDAIDFQLGASVGIVYSAFDVYKFDSKKGKHVHIDEEYGRILPYPVVSDVNLGFVYRFNSIRNQVAARDVAKMKEMSNLYEKRIAYDNNQRAQRSVDGIEQFLSVAYIDSLNKVLNSKNAEIRRINALYASADSLELLTELPNAYAFFELTEKEFIKSSKQTLPNMANISSVKELDNELLNRIVISHSGVATLDSLLVESYYSSRGNAIDFAGDSLAAVPLLDYLVNTISAVVNKNILAHNTENFGTRTVNKQANINSVAKVEALRRTASSPVIKNSAIGFLTRTDTLYLKQAESYAIKGKVEEIEIQNTIKRLLLEEITGIDSSVSSVAAPVEEKATKKEKKSKKKAKKAAEEVVTEAAEKVSEEIVTEEK